MATSKEPLLLRVSEARPKDVGRGVVRVDPEDMGKLGLEVGDIVQVCGKRKTVAKVLPAYVEDRGKGILQMDGLLRENAQVGLDERVSIERAACKPAQKMLLLPLTPQRSLPRERDGRYLGSLLEGLPLVEGDRIRANLFGARHLDFSVRSTSPPGPVLVHSGTAVLVEEEKGKLEPRAKVSYEDVGGLGREIRRVREMIELPLKYPQLFDRLGIEPPKGVLLHGPPGCGKTLIARAVANETEAYFTHLSGPEVMHKFYGESEAHLRRVFEDAAAHAPSIIFLDELDAIAPKREEMAGERQLERRVVAQLLALMDGLESRGEVIVIGATNLPNVIDPALRRPGRFDREIAIGIPDARGRSEILQIHTRGMPLAADVDLERLAQITHGFVGADLAALCREAAMTALRGVLPRIDFKLEEIPPEEVLRLEVGMEDFTQALKEVEPSAIREVFTEIPDVRWDEVGGLEEAKQLLRESVEWPLRYAPLFRHTRTRPPKGILLHGLPGTGKTLLAKALASETEVNFISVKGPSLMSKWVGEAERGVREVFRKAKQASPCIIFFDELDGLVPVRRGGGDSGVAERVISQFLTEMDGIEELKDVVVLGATNRLDLVDPALLRPGRFDLQVGLPLPDEAARLAIFEVHTRGKPLEADVDLARLAGEEAEGLAGADIRFLCERASMLAIREFVARADPGGEDPSKCVIAARHFEAALRQARGERGK